ncbi:MAG TPA: aminotransferase class V-fold PLP-dependent enzyme [Microbacteriaceae bacterium]|nr:aminotransferase class V-fold PLP-dependent enzyme [Microbacteriaceae bacterium]
MTDEGEFAAVRERARALDAADPLAAHRTAFVAHDDVIAYLDGNSLGRPLVATRERLAGFVEEDWGHRLIRSWDEGWMAAPTELGDEIGRIAIGAATGQTVVADSTTVLLYKLVRAAVAAQHGRDEIVADTENFPTDRFVVEGVAAERGLRVRWIEPDRTRGVTLEQVRGAVGDRTALVVLSHVAYKSGAIADLPAITAAVHDAGALVLWDLCHTVGAVPVELDAHGVDLAVGCTYKYLNGGPGSPAFAYLATRHHGRLLQPIHGWMGASDVFAMAEHYLPAPGIGQLISGTPPIIGMLPLRDALELIARAGMPAIRAKSVTLTAFTIEIADTVLARFGVQLATPREPSARGGHVLLEHPAFADIVPALWRRGVIPDFRHPRGLRIGLSPLSTSFAEVAIGMRAIAEELAART